MGQAASYSESSIHQALLKLKSKDVEQEDKLLALCGYVRPRHADGNSSSTPGLTKTSSVTSTTNTSSTTLAQQSNTIPCSSGAAPAATATAVAALVPSPLECAGLPELAQATTPPSSFGPLASLTPEAYTLDELRQALPYLPDALWISLQRVSLLYVLDQDCDGVFSRTDIARFTDWAIETVPPKVPTEQIAEVVQAQAALHCWRRCLLAGQRVEGEARLRPHRGGRRSASSPSKSILFGCEDPSTTYMRAALRETNVGTPAAAPPPEAGAPSLTPGREAAALGGAVQTPVTKQHLTAAALHFAHWVLRMLQTLERDRLAEEEWQQQRQRLLAQRTGGDKLSLSDAEAAALAEMLGRGPHVVEPPEDHLTLIAVEEMYMDFSVFESYGLRFWAFCRLLNLRGALAVEQVLGLAEEEAVRRFTCAAVVEEARRGYALAQLHAEDPPSPTAAPMSSSNRNSDDDGDGSETEGGAETMRPPPPMRPATVGDGSRGSLQSGFCSIPDFLVSRQTVLSFVFCFIKAYWDMLENIGFQPAGVGSAEAARESV